MRKTVLLTLMTLLVAMACALPAIAQSDETAKRFHVFPQLADGGGWQSFLLVTNAAQSSSFCAFELHGLTVDRFPEVSGITMSGSTATFEIPGPGGYRVWRTKNESALATGYATLDCTAPTVAQVLYASRDGSGVTGMATVFSSQAGTVFQFPVLTPEASLGIAIANDTITDASCRFVLESPDRQNLGEAPLSVPPKSNVARFLHEVIPVPGGFSGGSATVSCDQQVSVIGLQFAGAIFTTLPPTVLSTTAASLTPPAGRLPPWFELDYWDQLVFGCAEQPDLCRPNNRNGRTIPITERVRTMDVHVVSEADPPLPQEWEDTYRRVIPFLMTEFAGGRQWAGSLTTGNEPLERAGVIDVVFVPDGCASGGFWGGGGDWVRGIVRLSMRQDRGTDWCLRTVLLAHELGHVVGFQHVDDPDDFMCTDPVSRTGRCDGYAWSQPYDGLPVFTERQRLHIGLARQVADDKGGWFNWPGVDIDSVP